MGWDTDKLLMNGNNITDSLSQWDSAVGAVYDRARFQSLQTVRGHRPRLQQNGPSSLGLPHSGTVPPQFLSHMRFQLMEARSVDRAGSATLRNRAWSQSL